MKKAFFELGSSEVNALAKVVQENNYDYNEQEYEFDEERRNDAHTAVIRQIKDNSLVLDVGCASGILGSVLKRYKNCIVDGIEYDKKAYEVAKKKNIYREIYNFSITDENNADFKKLFNQKERYDFIIFADVLEHLVEPWMALINAAKMLKKGGSIIVSVPNIAHIDIIKSLINGEFNYSRWGILDSTHLRFFTANSFLDMIANINSQYKMNLAAKLCERILIKPPYFIDDQDYKLFNITGKLEDYLTLQTIFKITLSSGNKPKTTEKITDHTDYFDVMNQTFCELIARNAELEKANGELKEELAAKNQELAQIKNSKRYKFINKIGDTLHK